MEFSYFPTLRGMRRAGLQSKTYTTDAWSVIHASVRRRTRRGIERRTAVAFVEQAQEFYSAASAASTLRARPLLAYYAFLNLAKALCIQRGNARLIGAAQHGLSEKWTPGDGLKSAKLAATRSPAVPARPQVFDELLRTVTGAGLATNRAYRIHDLMACSLIGHRLWCDATGRADCFLKLERLEVVHDEAKEDLWLRVGIKRFALRRPGLSHSRVTTAGFGPSWEVVATPWSFNDLGLVCWQQRRATSYSGRPSDVLDELVAEARSLFYRSLTVSEPYRHYYVFIPPKRFTRHPQMLSRYALLFFFGSVTRYHPADFDRVLDSEYGPFISEFLASEPSQLLFEMACLFLEREVVSVGLA